MRKLDVCRECDGLMIEERDRYPGGLLACKLRGVGRNPVKATEALLRNVSADNVWLFEDKDIPSTCRNETYTTLRKLEEL